MKTRLLVSILSLVVLASISSANPFTRWQVTTSPTMQSSPVMWDSSIYYREGWSGGETSIWVHDIIKNIETPVIERFSEKIPVSANGKYLLYNEYRDQTNWYDVGVFNTETGVDNIIASGPENQVAYDMWGSRVLFTVGFAWPELYMYDTETGNKQLLIHEAIRPRIWGDTVVYIKSFGFGYSTVESYNITTGITKRITNSNGNNQTQPEIYEDKVVWAGLNDYPGIYYKNLTTSEERKIADKGEYPVIWGKFIAWNQFNNIYAYNIYTREIFKLSDDLSLVDSWEPLGTSFIYDNMVLWMSGWDIFAAKIQPGPKLNVGFSLYAVKGLPGQLVTLRSLVYGGGIPVSGLDIRFMVDGEVIETAISNPQGAEINYTIPANMPAGQHNVTVSFAGNASYNPVSKTSAILTIKKPKSNISFSPYLIIGSVGSKVPLMSLVYSKGAPVTGIPVQFYVDGELAGLGVSDQYGAKCTYTIPQTMTPGTHTLTMFFGGNNNYNPASRSCNVLIITNLKTP